MYSPSATERPAVNPTATRAGIPSERAMTAIVEAKWMQ
jgi:hypothetical protein